MSGAEPTDVERSPDETAPDDGGRRGYHVAIAVRSALSRDSFQAALDRRLGMDARSIAAFRVLVGLTLLFDVFHRATDLQAFYTDRGVLPRDLLYAESGWTAEYSLHALSGSATFQAVLFAATGLVAIALLIGYRPQFAALVAAGLVFSLHWRNPYVLNAGDRLLRELLLLAVFLPLAERWAVRSRRTNRSHVTTPATAGVLIYVVAIFFGNALEKRTGDTWPTGEALGYALRQDHMTILLGNHLAEYPVLLELGTYGWFGLLLSAPLLLVTADRGRLLHCLAFLGAVTGLGLSVAVGLFPPLLMAAIGLFLPARFWDGLERLSAGLRRHVAARFDRESIPDRVTTLAVDIRATGRRFGSILGRLDRRLTGAIECVYTPETRRLARGGWTVVLVAMLVFMSSLSVGMLGWADPFEPIDEVDADDYTWDVYAPNPSDSYGYWIVEAERDDAEPVDVLQEKRLSEAPPPDPASTFPSFRWRKYNGVLHGGNATAYREAYTDYMCTRADERFDGEVTSVTVTYTYQQIDHGGDPDRNTIEVATRDCTTVG